jgi:hypothetical protein
VTATILLRSGRLRFAVRSLTASSAVDANTRVEGVTRGATGVGIRVITRELALPVTTPDGTILHGTAREGFKDCLLSACVVAFSFAILFGISLRQRGAAS